MDEALESLAHEVVFAYDDINPTFSVDEREFLYEAAEKDVDSFSPYAYLPNDSINLATLGGQHAH